jgi:uncharacterized protein YjbJ (UPF0337 family)
MYGDERKGGLVKGTIVLRDGANFNPIGVDMNRDRLEGTWKQLSGKVREQWCLLTGDAPGMIAARRDQRTGWNQEGRGIAKEAVADQLKGFMDRNRDWDLTDR